LKTDRFQYDNMHSIHFPKQAEGESVTDFDAIPHKCQRKVYPIMPAHMELAMLRSDKMESIHERFGSAGKALAKHNANDFSNEELLLKSPSQKKSGQQRSFSDLPSPKKPNQAVFGRTQTFTN